VYNQPVSVVLVYKAIGANASGHAARIYCRVLILRNGQIAVQE
jgi:hypothetical protein